jgi:actin-related protein
MNMEFIPHVVVDCGYDTLRIGRAGEDNPQFIGPSQLGVLESSSDYVVGMDGISKYTEGLTLKPFMNQDGFISDYDTFEK